MDYRYHIQRVIDYGETELAELYKTVYESWIKAFELKKSTDLASADNRAAISELLKKAYECEKAANDKL